MDEDNEFCDDSPGLPMNDEEKAAFVEFEAFLEDEWEWETQIYHSTVKECRLNTFLNEAELDLVWDLWRLAMDCAFLMNVPRTDLGPVKRLHDGSTSRTERELMKVREQLFATSGWQTIPADLRSKVEERLFRVQIDDENLGG